MSKQHPDNTISDKAWSSWRRGSDAAHRNMPSQEVIARSQRQGEQRAAARRGRN